MAAGLAVVTLGSATAATGAHSLTVKAPFRVVNGSGSTVLQVGVNGLTIYQNKQIAAFLGQQTGLQALRFYNGGKVVAAIGAQSTGGAVVVRDPTGHPMVLLGETEVGGAVQVYNKAGDTPRAALESTEGTTGGLEILDASGVAVVKLEDHTGGGYLGIANEGGTARVEAGVLSNDRGDVRAYGPGGFNYIRGRGTSGSLDSGNSRPFRASTRP